MNACPRTGAPVRPSRRSRAATLQGLGILGLALALCVSTASALPGAGPGLLGAAFAEDESLRPIPITQTVAPCHKQCAPLIGSVKPVEEASRVYRNCRALCDRKGSVTCPDGRKVSYARAHLCSR